MRANIVRTAALTMGVCLVLLGSANAQRLEKPVKMKDLPEAVRKTVQEQSAGGKLRGLVMEVEDGQTVYEAELQLSGHKRDVLIDEKGAVVQIEEEIPYASLPADVKAIIEQKAGKARIKSVESITKNNVIVAYEAHASRAGKALEIKVGADGKLISVEEMRFVVR
jgi:hypothetical protein